MPTASYYGLAAEVDSLTVRIVYCVKVELLRVPVSLETGIGF